MNRCRFLGSVASGWVCWRTVDGWVSVWCLAGPMVSQVLMEGLGSGPSDHPRDHRQRPPLRGPLGVHPLRRCRCRHHRHCIGGLLLGKRVPESIVPNQTFGASVLRMVKRCLLSTLRIRHHDIRSSHPMISPSLSRAFPMHFGLELLMQHEQFVVEHERG